MDPYRSYKGHILVSNYGTILYFMGWLAAVGDIGREVWASFTTGFRFKRWWKVTQSVAKVSQKKEKLLWRSAKVQPKNIYQRDPSRAL